MAILYPNEIYNVFIRDVEFTGNIVSAGDDGNYAYDYDHPVTAINSEPSGTLVLIYPGSYYTGGKYYIPNKDFMFRGMGDDPTDVYFYPDGGSGGTIQIAGSYSEVILENFRASQHAPRNIIYFTDGSVSTNFSMNKLQLDEGNNSVHNVPLHVDQYAGNGLFLNSKIYTNQAQYNGLGNSNGNAIYVFRAMEYTSSYLCYVCAIDPVVHTYSTSPATGYGYDYGDFIIQFNIPAPAPIYQNVWAQGDYIYHTTPSGVDVYNDDASSVLNHIALPSHASAVWADDDYVYMGTMVSGVYRSTASGVATQFLSPPDINSDRVIYLHGYGPYLCLTTESGVNRWDLTSSSGIRTYLPQAHKCKQLADGTFYYIENHRFYNVDEDDLGGSLSSWEYYQHLTFEPAFISSYYVLVTFVGDFPYSHAQSEGDDLRFIDVFGNNLDYYIQEWSPDAKVLVRVSEEGTNAMFMLYGNDNAGPQSTYFDLPEDDDIPTSDELLWGDLIRPRFHVMYSPTSNWLTADYTYEEFYGSPSLLNDIHTTSGTSTTGDNTIFLASDRGAYIIDERQGDEGNADVKRYYIK